VGKWPATVADYHTIAPVATAVPDGAASPAVAESRPLDAAGPTSPRPVTLRLTLALMVLAAAGYVAAISIYIAVRIAPTAAALQNFREETTVRHDSTERLASLDAALHDVQRLLGSEGQHAQIATRASELQHAVQQVLSGPDPRKGIDNLPDDIKHPLLQADEAERGLGLALLRGLAAIADGRHAEGQMHIDEAERLRALGAARLDDAYALELDDLREHQRLLHSASSSVVFAVEWWLVVAAICAPFAAIFIHHRLYRPLADLDSGLARVADGDLKTAIEMRRADELGRLAQHFNRMTAVLRERAEEERLRTERKTQYLQEQLIERERLAALGRMAGAIAHEVGTPLTSVLGYTQLLAKEDLSERGRQRVKIIESQVQRMAEIIQTYLARTRGVPSERRTIEANELVRGTIDQLRLMLRRSGHRMTLVDGGAPPPIIGDLDGLHRVLVNLIQNAADAMPGGGEIIIRTERVDPPLAPFAGVVVEVADSGGGIPADVLPKIFDLFFTTKPQGRGTGMGLAICHEIVKAHRGRIDVASEVGKGTRMRVLLPLEGSPDVEAHSTDRG
jgi:signal transduction histidine kinase